MAEKALSHVVFLSDGTIYESDSPSGISIAEAQTLIRPDPDVLQLYRYLWQPACYAAPEWLRVLGFYPDQHWCYGVQPDLDRCLDSALRTLRGCSVINALLGDRQRRLVRLAPRLASFALGLGLVKIGRSDYFMLPDYRRVLSQWLSEDEIWRMYGWCGQGNRQLLSPMNMAATAIQIGTLILHRVACDEPVLQALLIRLPPPERALWPRVSHADLSFLEYLL